MTTEDVLKHARAKPQLYSFVTADDLCQALTEYVIRVRMLQVATTHSVGSKRGD